MRPIVLIATLGAALLSLSRFAHAEAFPWITIGADDVQIISNVKTDLAMRLDLISKAKTSIDIAVYDVRPDNAVTYPILYALRLAADRGVKVRILTSYIPQLGFDRLKHQAHYLMQPATLVPIEYEVVGGESRELWKWGMLDTIHEKYFMVDHKYFMTTGRGFGTNYMEWLDTDFAVRGGLAEQAAMAFEDTWRAARRQRSLLDSSFWWLFAHYLWVKPYTTPDTLWPDTEQAAEVLRLEQWMNETSDPTTPRAQARVLHHDFLHQLEIQPRRPTDLKIADRLAILVDPVIDAVCEKLATTSEARLSTLSLVLNPKLKAALIKAARRGAHITIMTNTTSPALSLEGLVKHALAPSGPIWDIEVPDVDDLEQAGIDVRQFQTSPDTPWLYLHRKLAILDDTVIFGSHNLNLPSTTFNDETSYEVVSPELAAKFRAVYDRDLMTNSGPLDPAVVHSWRKNIIERVLDDLLSPMVGIM